MRAQVVSASGLWIECARRACVVFMLCIRESLMRRIDFCDQAPGVRRGIVRLYHELYALVLRALRSFCAFALIPAQKRSLCSVVGR